MRKNQFLHFQAGRVRIMIAVAFALNVPIASAVETGKSACKPSDLTEKTCGYFRSHVDQSEFVLADGRSFANPLALQPVVYPIYAGATNSAQDPAKNEQMMNDMLEMYMSVAQTLRESSLKKLPARSMQALTLENNASALIGYIAHSKSPKANPSYVVPAMLPFPITNQLAPLKTYNQEQLKSIADQLTNDEKNKLVATVETVRKKYPGPAMSQASMLMATAPATQKTDLLSQRREETKELFAEAVKDMEAVIRNGSPDPLSGEKKAQIDKIRLITLKNGNDPAVASNPFCVGNAINAFYNPADHTFAICDGAANLPRSHLMLLIGHELGHAIDSCLGPTPLHKINFEKMARLQLEHSASAANNPQNELAETALQRLASIAKPPRDLTNLNLPFRIGPLSYQYLLKQGVLETQVSGVSLDRDPVDSVRKCLVSDFGFQDVTPEDIEPKIKETADAVKRIGANWVPENENKLRAAYYTAKRCEGNGTKVSELYEASADVYGSGDLSRYLQRHPPKDVMDQAALTAIFNKAICSSGYAASGAKAPVDVPPIQMLSAVSSITAQALGEPHPQDAKRVESVIYRFPGVASALGCSSITPGCTEGMRPGVFDRAVSTSPISPNNSSDATR